MTKRKKNTLLTEAQTIALAGCAGFDLNGKKRQPQYTCPTATSVCHYCNSRIIMLLTRAAVGGRMANDA